MSSSPNNKTKPFRRQVSEGLAAIQTSDRSGGRSRAGNGGRSGIGGRGGYDVEIEEGIDDDDGDDIDSRNQQRNRGVETNSFTARFALPTPNDSGSFFLPPGQHEQQQQQQQQQQPRQNQRTYSLRPSQSTRERQILVFSPPPPASQEENNQVQNRGVISSFFTNLTGGTNQEEILEEYELFYDTFTFLMAGRYPLDFCWGDPDKEKKQEYDEEEHLQERTNSKSARAAAAAIALEEEEFQDVGVNIMSSKERDQLMARKRLEMADSDFLCLPFWVGWFINMSQLFIYTIVIANVFRNKMPPNADRWLRLAQIFAMVVTLYTQSDFIDGVFLFTERWKPFKGITTPIKFNASAIMRILSGIAGIVSTFILVVYSTEVVDLLLNFTAMEFVATLDGSAFELSSKGFLGVTLEKKCLEIQDFRYQRRVRHGSLTRLFAYSFCVLLVFAAFVIIVILQSRRLVGVDNEVYIQFDDTDVPDLYGISGVYVGCEGFRTKQIGDIGYVDIGVSLLGSSKQRKGNECPALATNEDGMPEIPRRTFVYCWDLGGWVYTTKITTEPCKEENHLMRSFLDGPPLDSNSFDILTHSKATWLINQRSDTGGKTLLDFAFIEAVGSFDNSFTQCDGRGLLPTHYSWATRAFAPLENNKTYYPYFDDKSYRDIFGLMYRPIFQKKVKYQQNRFQVVLFDGLRWNWMYLNPSAFADAFNKTDECKKKNDPECWKVFVKYHHAFPEWISLENVVWPRAISSPMRFLTPTDMGVPTTESLKWFEPIPSGSGTRVRIRPGKEILDTAMDDDVASFDFNIEGDGPFGFECARATATIQCTENEQTIDISLTTDIFINEIEVFVFWGQDENDIQQLTDENFMIVEDTEIVYNITENLLSRFSFSEPEVTYGMQSCAPNTATSCVQIVVADSFGDGIFEPGGYQISAGDENFVEGLSGEEFSCRRYQFGRGCSSSPGNMIFSGPFECNRTIIVENTQEHSDFVDDDPFFDYDFNSTFVPTARETERFTGQVSEFYYDDDITICLENGGLDCFNNTSPPTVV